MTNPIFNVMRQYAERKGTELERVGVYRYEPGGGDFKQEEWDTLKQNPTFEEKEAFINALGQTFTVGLYMVPKVPSK